MKYILLTISLISLLGCAYDPFGNKVTDDPGFGMMYIIVGAIIVIAWLVGKFKK